jgi:hypothetical protein
MRRTGSPSIAPDSTIVVDDLVHNRRAIMHDHRTDLALAAQRRLNCTGYCPNYPRRTPILVGAHGVHASDTRDVSPIRLRLLCAFENMRGNAAFLQGFAKFDAQEA